jgi:hypothetical protein
MEIRAKYQTKSLIIIPDLIFILSVDSLSPIDQHAILRDSFFVFLHGSPFFSFIPDFEQNGYTIDGRGEKAFVAFSQMKT